MDAVLDVPLTVEGSATTTRPTVPTLPIRKIRSSKRALQFETVTIAGDNGDRGDTLPSFGFGVPDNQKASGDNGDTSPDPQASNAVTAPTTAWLDDSEFENREPKMEERPRFVNRFVGTKNDNGKGWLFRPGLWFYGSKAARGDHPPTPINTRIGEPLKMVGHTANSGGGNFGRVLKYTDTLQRERTYALAMRKLAGDGVEFRSELLDAGYAFDTTAGALLTKYVNGYPVAKLTHFNSVDRTGWHGGGDTLAYVFPDTVIGAQDYILQADDVSQNPFTVKGTLEQWREQISRHAGSDNPLMTLAISTAFAGALLHRVGMPSVGVHLYGSSSRGKTTALQAACSVWGSATLARKWTNTKNGMEASAALSNDALLALDEIGQADARDTGTNIYALMDGTGKARATRTGGARPVRKWRAALLSTGEHSMIQAIEAGGKKAAAGQAVRLLDVAIGDGVIKSHAGFDSAGALVDSIKVSVENQHGTAAREFVTKLHAETRCLREEYETLCKHPEFAREEGQERRAGAAFAAIAVAGELATEYGITGWQLGEATAAAADAFAQWLKARGGSGQGFEKLQTLVRIREFIERFGDARFQPFEILDGERSINDRAGWVKSDGTGGKVFLFTTVAFRQALGDIDPVGAARALEDAGWIAHSDADKSKPFQWKPRIPSLGTTARVYAIRPIDDDAAGGER